MMLKRAMLGMALMMVPLVGMAGINQDGFSDYTVQIVRSGKPVFKASIAVRPGKTAILQTGKNISYKAEKLSDGRIRVGYVTTGYDFMIHEMPKHHDYISMNIEFTKLLSMHNASGIELPVTDTTNMEDQFFLPVGKTIKMRLSGNSSIAISRS